MNKAYRLKFPYDKNLVDIVKKVKDSYPYSIVKQHGKIEYFDSQTNGKYWLFPAFYKDDLTNILENYLED